MSKFEGVADTLYIPLTARIYVSEHFPEYFRDDKASRMERSFFFCYRKELYARLPGYLQKHRTIP